MNPTVVACPELPLPVKDPISGVSGSVRNLEINSLLTPEKVIGHLHRNYPPPSISHTFLRLLKYASDSLESPGSSPLIALIGEKGTGKTSAAELAYYLVDGENPEVFDCGNKSLDELIWEPILADSSRGLIAPLQERYNSGTLNPLTRTHIETELADLVKTDAAGNKTLDWGRLGEPAQGQTGSGSAPGPGQATSRKRIEAIEQALRLEGIAAQTGLEISYREGPLIRAWRRGKEAQDRGEHRSCRLIIDEIDKRVRNTGASLQQVWLVLQGLRQSHTVQKNGMEFTFDRNDMPKGFSVVITGNDSSDLSGESQTGLSQSQASRMTILTVGKSTEEDIAHRLCQFLTGMSFGIVDLMPQNAKIKGRLLEELRVLGTDKNICADQAALIRNHEKTYQAARQLAAFYSRWAELVDPEDPAFEDPDIEKNSSYREPPGVRMAHVHINRAFRNDLLDIVLSGATDSRNPLQSLLTQKTPPTQEMPPLGERVCRVILEAVPESTRSAALKAKVLESAKIYGLTPETEEEKNANKLHKSISVLLDTREAAFKIQKETRSLQKALYETLLKTHGASLGDPPPPKDDLLPLRDLQSALNSSQEKAKSRTTGDTTYILNINPNYLEGNRSEQAVECIPVLCPRGSSQGHEAIISGLGKEKIREAMMETNTLMAILKTADLGESTLDALWDEGWKGHLAEILEGPAEETKAGQLKSNQIKSSECECIQIADGSSNTLRVARVMTMGENDKPEVSLIFQSRNHRKTWVISENGQRDTLQGTDTSLETYGADQSKALWEDIQDTIPPSELHPEDLPAALGAFNNLDPETKPDVSDAIEKAFRESETEKSTGRRSLRNTKIPLRVDMDEVQPEGP